MDSAPHVIFPGPRELGRSVVIGSGDETPTPWVGCDRVVIDSDLLAEADRLASTVDDIQRRYVRREPTVFELCVPDTALNTPESTRSSPWELGSAFTFLRERLSKAVWHNSYDARAGNMIWWWSRKAEPHMRASIGGPADLRLPDGEPVWVDGGPRQQLSLTEKVVHHESLAVNVTPNGSTRPAPVEDLAPDQLAAVLHEVGPARIIAPAGSGKTRVLTARMWHLIGDRGVEPEIVTAVAYNRLAAAEMRDRLPGDRPLNIRTIHSLGWEVLRVAKPHLRLIDEREQRQMLQGIVSAPHRANTDVIGPYIEGLGEVRIGLRSPEEVEANRDDIPLFAGAFDRYRSLLDSRGEADHDEQIYGAIEVLCRDPDLRAHWQHQCQHLLVDEFQDLTPGYLMLLRLLASPGMNVFGVGDDDQVIYGYAGADPEYLIGFEGLFPGAGTHTLEVNYRCPTDVVDAAVLLLSHNSRRVDKAVRSSAKTEGLAVVRVPGDAMGVAAADRIAAMLGTGVAADTISVLSRVNSSLLPVQAALAERGIPFQSILSVSVLNRTVLRAALSWMRLALAPDSMDRNDLFEAVRRPGRGINRVFTELMRGQRGSFSVERILEVGRDLEGRRLERWIGFCDDIEAAVAATDSTTRLIEVLATSIGLDRAAAALDAGRSRADRASQSDDLTALRRLAVMGPEPDQFEAWLREKLSVSSASTGVTLSSVHRAKGLEWDHVLVFGADKGSMPHALSDDIEEERRVFHVALTRGRNSVVVFSDKDRPSRFVDEMEGKAPTVEETPTRTQRPRRARPENTDITASVGDLISAPGGHNGEVIDVEESGVLIRVGEGGAEMLISWGEKIVVNGAAGSLVREAAPVEEAFVERLKAWRLENARTQGVPAFVVFSDKTLHAIATTRPSTPEELLDVPGIGPAKLDTYGDDLLDLLADL